MVTYLGYYIGDNTLFFRNLVLHSRDQSFAEWQAERLGKAPARGGVQSPISPNAGLMVQPGYTPSRAPTGPQTRRSGMQGEPGPKVPSKYQNQDQSQPTPWIDDVGMDENWFSPFQPVWPFGPPQNTIVREWDYPVGYNLNFVPQRLETIAMLRGLRQSWGVLATIIETRKDQLLRIPWTIQLRDKPRAVNAGVTEMRKFFRRPDGKLSYSQWSRKLLDDMLVIDAATLYFPRDRRGRVLAAEVVDGGTIFPLIDDAGRRPDSDVEIDQDGLTYLRRQPAFQQIIKGLPMIDLDESQLMYAPMRLRTDMPMFGYPGTEQILIEATEAVKKTLYQLQFWTEGSIPDLIITVPDTWQPRQIAMFQAHFDAMLSGNLRLKSKARFVPGGMKPFDIKNSSGESLWSQRDELLVRLACYAYSVSPTPFVKQMNRSTANNAQQTAEEEGLYPLMSWWKDDIMDTIIQDKFGRDDIEFMFLPRPEPDSQKQAKIHEIQVKTGYRTVNEVRDELGEEPLEGGDVAMIEIGNGVIPLLAASKGLAAPVQGGDQTSRTVGEGNSEPKKPNGTNGSSNQASPQRGAARPTSASPQPSPVHKVSRQDVREAAAESDGDIDRVSHLQQHVGNYKKGHIWIQGLNISIENEKGSRRGEKDQNGIKWQVKMPAPYGYIRGFIGADGMQIDCYIGKHPDSATVFVIDQDKVDTSGKNLGFDEHKCMIGYKKAKRAVKDWLKSHFEDFSKDKLRAVVEISMQDFKSWLKDGDLKSPIAEQGVGKVVLTQSDLSKSDTISASTGLGWYDQTSVGHARPAKRKKRKSKSGPRWRQLAATTN